MRAIVALALCAALLPATSHARVEVPAMARYATQDGRSGWQRTDVTLVSGQELNAATSSFSYDSLGHYVVIFFSQNQAAVIHLSTMLFCSGEATAACLPAVGNMQGRDQGGREWEICTNPIC